MNELNIIYNIKKIIKNPSALNLNDDVFFDKKKKLLASIDTYNEKIHYLDFKYPDLIIKKAIRSSISDIISKGSDPKYILLSFSGTKKNFSSKNIQLIINSIKQEQKKFKFSLVGGDISKSSKSSFTICVFSFSKKIIQRNNCYINDDLYVTGTIGDASIGLEILKKKIKTDQKSRNFFLESYFAPKLAFGFHKELNKIATSSIDVSDGLLTDIKKLVNSKKRGFIIDSALIPKSIYFKKFIKQNNIFNYNHLFNGDDYQILFTSKKKYRTIIIKKALKWNQKITRIGNITSNKENYIKYKDKLKKIINYQGYIHSFE